MSTPLLTVESLRLETASGAVLVRDLSFRLDTGERLGMLGESGSGKTLTGLAVAGLLPATLRQSGHIEIHRAGAAPGPRARRAQSRPGESLTSASRVPREPDDIRSGPATSHPSSR